MSPSAESNQIPELARSKRFWGRVAWASGITVVIAPLLGTPATIAGMLQGFGKTAEQRAADSAATAAEIRFALQATMWGLGISFLSMLLFAVALTLFLKRRKALQTLRRDAGGN